MFENAATPPKKRAKVSINDLDDSLVYFTRTSNKWFNGTLDSVNKRLETVNRIDGINTHLMDRASWRHEDITLFTRVHDAMKLARAELREIQEKSGMLTAELNMTHAQSFAIHTEAEVYPQKYAFDDEPGPESETKKDTIPPFEEEDEGSFDD